MTVLKTLLAIFVFASGVLATDAADCHLVAGWQQDGSTREFDADDLFEYLDGEAEGYLIYGFVCLQNTTCTKGDETIILDISEMADSDAAYGIFTAHRDPDRPVLPIGTGAQILARHAILVKDKFYVRISTSSDRDANPVLKAYATEIEKRIEGTSAPPKTIAWFPQEGLISIRLIPESVLGLSALRRGYVAQYEEGKAFIVKEDSPESAAAVLARLRDRFGETTRFELADEAYQAKDRYLDGLCLFRKGRYIGGYANLADAAVAANLAKTLAARIP